MKVFKLSKGYLRSFLIGYLVIFVIAITALVIHLVNTRSDIKKTALKELENISSLKESDIINFISEEKYKLNLLVSSDFFRKELVSFFMDNSKLNQLIKILYQIKSIKDLENIVLIDSTGKIIHSFYLLDENYDSLTIRLLSARLVPESIIDVFETKGSGISYFFQFPIIIQEKKSNRLIGFIRFQFDALTYLIPRFEHLEPSSTREVVLLKRDKDNVIYLSHLRKVSLKPMTLKESTNDRICWDKIFATSYCEFEGLDYAGTPVLGILRKIKHTDLVLFTKQDQKEIYQSFKTYAFHVSISVILFLLTSGFAFGYFIVRSKLKMDKQEIQFLKSQELIETQFKTLIESMNDSLFVINQDGIIVNVNTKVIETYGYAKDELLNKTIDLVCTESFEELKTRFSRIIKSNGYIYETIHRKKNGVTFDVEVSAKAYTVDGNYFILWIVRDISDRKLNTIKLGKSLDFQKFLTKIAEELNLINYSNFESKVDDLLEIAGQYLKVDRIKIFIRNEATGSYNCISEWCATGIPKMKDTLQFLDIEKEFVYLFSNLMSSGTIKIYDTEELPPEAINEYHEMKRQDIKSVFWKALKFENKLIGFLSVNSVKEKTVWSDDIEAFLNIFADSLVNVLRRVNFEKKIIEKEEWFRKIIENSSEVILIIDSHLVNKFVSPSIKNVLGFTPEERIGHSALELVHKDDLGKIPEIFEQIKEHGSQVQFDLRVRHKNGHYIWLEITATNLLYDSVINGYVVNYHEITELKEANLKLQESEERYRLLAEETGDVLYKLNYSTMKYDYMSPLIEKLIGYTPAQLNEIGISKIIKKIEFIFKPEYTIEEAVRERILGTTGEYLADYLVETRDGKFKWIRDHSFPLLDDEGGLYGSIGVLSDITELKQKEQEILKRQNYLNVLVEIQKSLIFLEDLNKFYNYMLLKLGEVVGASRCYVFENHYDESGELLMSQKAEWYREGITPQIYNPELQNLPYNAIGYDLISDFQKEGCFNKIVKTLPEPLKSILEFQDIKSLLLIPIFIHDEFFGYIGFDDCESEHVWTDLEIDILKSAASSIALAIEALRRNEEIIKARDEAIEANRLKSHFLSVMSHEIRTPLNSIMGYTELLKELFYESSVEEIKKYFDTITRNTERLFHTINQIIEISRIEAGGVTINSKSLDLIKHINEIVQIFELKAKEKKLQIELNLPENGLNIISDEFCVHGILENIISNAIKYSSKGKIQISAKALDNFIEVIVKDEGEGISEEYQKHMFHPFSQEDMSYKRKYEGTGLGLAITKRYLDLIGGEISIRSKKGEGTTVTLRFRK